MNLSTYVVPIIIGLATGMVTYLSAAGMNLLISGMGIMNFAQGSFYVLGMMICYQIGSVYGLWIGLLGAVIFSLICGAALEFILRPVSSKGMMPVLLSTMGIGYVIDAIFQVTLGNGNRTYSLAVPEFLRGPLKVGTLVIPKYYLFMMGIALVIALLFWIMFKKTKLGMLFRAIISDRNMVESLGVNVQLLYTVMFMIGIALTGFAGALNLPSSGFSTTGSSSAFASIMPVLIIGGLGNMQGVLPAAILVGGVQAIAALFLPTYYNLVPTFLMILTILFKPEGLFTRRVK